MGPAALPSQICHPQGWVPAAAGVLNLANNVDYLEFLEAGDDFCKLDYQNEDLSDLTIKLDRSKILTTGRKGEYPAGWDPSTRAAGVLTRYQKQPSATFCRSSTSTSRLPTLKTVRSFLETCPK